MRPNCIQVLSLLVLALGGCAPQRQNSSLKGPAPHAELQRQADTETPAGFDYFLLNLSWSPEFCHSHPSATECSQHPAFVLHGLWPERNDGSFPENCSNAPGPSKPEQYADVYPDAMLLKHEWRTHGTCSGMAADAYFASARAAYNAVKIPPKLAQLSEQITLTPDAIRQLFQQTNPGLPSTSVVISCGNNYLTAVEVCLDKSLHATECGTLRACHATSVRIPAP